MLKILKVLNPLIIGIAFIGAIAWAVCSPDFEPAITSLALLASLLAIFLEKWISERERRKELLIVLLNELFINMQYKSDLQKIASYENVDKMHIYPRFHTSSLANVIASGAFTGAKDSSLFQHMNLWHQFASDYNNRLYHTELRVFNNKDAARTYNSLLVNGEVGQQAFKTLNELMDMLLKEYKNETEINSNNIETKLKVALNRRA